MNEPSITAGGIWCGHPVSCPLDLVSENPVRYEGPLSLPTLGVRRCATVFYWPATEQPLWLVKLPAPEAFDTDNDDGIIIVRVQKYEFQALLTELAAKLESVRAWVNAIVPQ
jgi:hypothetical protein